MWYMYRVVRRDGRPDVGGAAMFEQTISKRAWTTASPSEVDALLRDGATWPVWSPLESFTLEQEGPEGGESLGAIRVFTTGRATSREEIVVLEPERSFGYALLSGLPLKGYRARRRPRAARRRHRDPLAQHVPGQVPRHRRPVPALPRRLHRQVRRRARRVRDRAVRVVGAQRPRVAFGDGTVTPVDDSEPERDEVHARRDAVGADRHHARGGQRLAVRRRRCSRSTGSRRCSASTTS